MMTTVPAVSSIGSAGQQVELVVGPVAHGGHCVARLDGKVVFVRHALPGERVRAVITEGDASSRFLRADAVQILEPSPDRVTPPCPFAGPGRCGGCDWQHASLPAQRQLKASVIAEAMRRFAGLDVDVDVESVPGDQDGLGWRTRVHYAVDASGQVGLRRHRSHEVIPVDVCRLAHPQVQALEVTGRRWPATSGVDVVGTPEGERGLVWQVTGPVPSHPPALPAAALTGVLVRAGGTRARLAGRTWLHRSAAGRSWRVSLDSFWQVHPGAAQALVEAVCAGLGARPGERVADLYAGVGLFAGVLADYVGPTGQVVAVESDGHAVADARRNLHDRPWVVLHHARVGEVTLDPVDLVVVDPPRSGVGRRVVERIVAARPRAVAYVACDPVALARDVATFAGYGYRMDGLRAFDVFPMTAHVECVATLRPDGALS